MGGSGKILTFALLMAAVHFSRVGVICIIQSKMTRNLGLREISRASLITDAHRMSDQTVESCMPQSRTWACLFSKVH